MRNFGELLSLIKYPLITEKAINLYGAQQYTFIVEKSLSKTEIKYTLEKFFNVKIIDVCTLMIPSKTRRVGKFIGKKSLYKKAYIKLKEGDSIKTLFDY